jgi:DNA-binding FrmR family transcriptional regulator
VLKGTRFESIDAVKAKVAELINKVSEDDLQHCFQQWTRRMERGGDQGGEYMEGDNISIV